MNNIFSAQKNSAIFLATLLVLGTISTISPSFMLGAQADSYLEMENNYEKSYGNDNIDKFKDSNVIVKKINCNNINVNSNGLELSVLPPFLASSLAAEAQEGSPDANAFTGISDGSQINDFRFICINNNNNTVIGGGEETLPPEPTGPPEPIAADLTVTKTTICDSQEFGDICNINYDLSVTGNNPTPSTFTASDTPIVVTLDAGAYSVIEAEFQPGLAQCAGFDGGLQVGPNTYTCTDFSEDCSGDISAGESLSCNINNVVIDTTPPPATLTVKKQVFGCDNIFPNGPQDNMNCRALQNDSPAWLDCNNSNISNTIFCQSLPESFFDIEVLDEQDTQIQQFVGSEQGTTIENLEPGTYTVNEIKHISPVNQLAIAPSVEEGCISVGFTDGGFLINSTSTTNYIICFEYEEEQGGNDCSTITLAAGEERTCIVKNYIRGAVN